MFFPKNLTSSHLMQYHPIAQAASNPKLPTDAMISGELSICYWMVTSI